MSDKMLPHGILEDKENVIISSREGVLTLWLLCFYGVLAGIFFINPELISVTAGILIEALIIYSVIDIKTSNVWLTDRAVILKKFNKFHKISYKEIRTFEFRRYSRGRWDEALEIETIQGKKFEFQDINGEELFEKYCDLNPNYIPKKLAF